MNHFVGRHCRQATLGQAMLRQATLRQANALAGHTHLCLVSLVTPRGHAQVSKTCLGRQAGENQAHKGTWNMPIKIMPIKVMPIKVMLIKVMLIKASHCIVKKPRP